MKINKLTFESSSGGVFKVTDLDVETYDYWVRLEHSGLIRETKIPVNVLHVVFVSKNKYRCESQNLGLTFNKSFSVIIHIAANEIHEKELIDLLECGLQEIRDGKYKQNKEILYYEVDCKIYRYYPYPIKL